jgi:DNA replication and repair protein RecF
LFHVEPEFLPWWRRYARALKQRNAALKSGPSPAALAPWERELAEAGEVITRMRQAYLGRLEPFVAAQGATYLAELGAASLDFRPGWKRQDLPLADALLMNRDRDIASGHTGVGPHRADWRLGFAGLPGGEALSRGQEKLAALACILGQAAGVAAEGQGWPLVCLDDLASELDRRHQRQVLQSVLDSGAQVLLTGTQAPEALAELGLAPPTFHVEHGQVRGT